MGKYVIQLHAATRLHYDFRIQIGRVLKSWAIPKGPSLSTKDKRLAVPTEDHSLSYFDFEGHIPEGQYGAGTVLLWDIGTYRNIHRNKQGKIMPMEECFKEGHIEIEIEGEKLKGGFALFRFREDNWLLVKKKDQHASDKSNIVTAKPHSVKSNKTLDQLKQLL
ncbi:MAG: hypothetical protein KR126chlam2_00282 [Chlamydiae bacterium]|nr:hypothetical protein [Chlamydiota bacterium]